MAAQARPSEGAAAPAAATLMGGGAGSAGGGGGAFFSRYGFKTEASGSVQVRLHCLHQTGGAGAGCGRNGGSSPQKQQQRRRGGGSEGGAQQAQRELSLAVVLERARARLEDARAGGGEVAVRGGVASAAPFVCKQPADAAVDEGGTASFSVVAGVRKGARRVPCLASLWCWGLGRRLASGYRGHRVRHRLLDSV